MSRRASRSGQLREVLRLLRPFWPITLFSTVIGTLGGLATAWLLATINISLHSGEGVTVSLLAPSAGMCMLSVGSSRARILRAPIAAIEQQRSYRLMAVLANDVDTVSAFTFNLAGYAAAFAIVTVSLIYLLILSPFVFMAVLAATALGVVINIFAKGGWIKDCEGVRGATDDLQKQYRAITDGAKKLRMTRERRLRVHRVLLAGAAGRIAALKSRAMRLFWIADAAGSAIFFVVIDPLLAARHGLGLYKPTSGQLLLDGEQVSENRLDDYRQLFSAVFSDYFLFDDLASADPALVAQANNYLDRLEIAYKVRFENGVFTTTDLSTGQKKRLTLAHAYLERQPVMIFDEWAADQDPIFRRVFYTELLPDLKRQGETLIVVSHDDRYFDAADRVIRLEAVRMVEERTPTANLDIASGAS